MKKFTFFLKNILPWLMAAGIFYYLFSVYPPSQIFASLKQVKLLPFLSFSLFYFFFIYFCDSWVMARVISRFTHHVSLKDILLARGVTYLIMVINYPASQAAFAYYLKRRYNIPIFQVVGVFLFMMILDLSWIILLAFAGSCLEDVVLGGVHLSPYVHTVAIMFLCFFLGWIIFWRRWHEKIFGTFFRFAWIEKIRQQKVFHIFEQARLKDYLSTALLRIPIHFTIIVSIYIVVQTFDAFIPFTKIIGNIPIVFLIGMLPITPGGLGTTNAAMVEMLSPFMTSPLFTAGKISPEELMLAMSLLWMFINYLLKALLGMFLLRKVSKNLFKPTTDESLEDIEKKAAHLGGNI